MTSGDIILDAIFRTGEEAPFVIRQYSANDNYQRSGAVVMFKRAAQ